MATGAPARLTFRARLRRRLKRFMKPPRRLSFTREGKIFCAISLGIGFAAVNTGNNLLYLLLGWSLSVITASGLLSELELRRLEIVRRAPGRVHAGQPCEIEVTVKNRKKRVPAFSVELEDLVGEEPRDERCYFLKIPAGRSQSTTVKRTFLRRGMARIDGVRVSTRFPFGLFRKIWDREEPFELLVFPALIPVELPPPPIARGGADSRTRVGRRGEFLGLRELRQGDDPRDVHWRSSARAGKLLVREYEDEAHRRATIRLDDGVAGQDAATLAAFEHAVSRAASLAIAYLERGWAVRLVARGVTVPSGVGPAQTHRLLRALALLEPVPASRPWAAPDDPASALVTVAAQAAG